MRIAKTRWAWFWIGLGLACAPHEREDDINDPLEGPELLDEDDLDLRELPLDEGLADLEDDPGFEDPQEAGASYDLDDEAARACDAGRQDARTHVEADVLMIETFGLPAGCRGDYARLLREQYEIDLNAVAGCVVSTWIVEHARCYNEVMETEIDRRHGTGTLDRVAKKAGCR